MSYCRWSDDDYQCDVYVYSDCAGGFTTHVAGRRHVFKEPLPEKVPFDDVEKYVERHSKVMDMCDDATFENIGLDYDGDSFNHDTAKECADNLITLKEAGYNVPQYAINGLMEEK
ncbi:MAG: hypothetical protein KAR06_03680 [Deltaproteobacteria bacterium]|nr:hypothetical protein [Deltaproteobacteria bacterium]